MGGEHGDAAIPLWSTVKINNLPIEEYCALLNKALPKDEISAYVKSVSKFIVDFIGGTEFGPAASFRDITRAIVRDTSEVLSVAVPQKFEGIPDPVFVGMPMHVGRFLGPSLYGGLSALEKMGLTEAAGEIWRTYQIALEQLE